MCSYIRKLNSKPILISLLPRTGNFHEITHFGENSKKHSCHFFAHVSRISAAFVNVADLLPSFNWHFTKEHIRISFSTLSITWESEIDWVCFTNPSISLPHTVQSVHKAYIVQATRQLRNSSLGHHLLRHI